MRILFRADASHDEGGGHLVRTLVIARELAKRGHDCILASLEGSIDLIPGGINSLPRANFSLKQIKKFEYSNPKALFEKLPANWNPDLCFIDSYCLQKEYQTELRKFTSKLAVLDDMPWREHDADILIDPTLNRKSDEYKLLVPPTTKLLCGVEYAPLRAEFFEARQKLNLGTFRSQYNTRKHILVSVGLTDPENITAIMLNGLLEVQNEFDITVLISSKSPFEQEIDSLIQQFKFNAKILRSHSHMADLLSTCDLVIGAGGSSSWERCCLGVPALQVILADNQKDVTESLARTGAIQSLGLMRDFSPEIVTKSVSKVLANSQTLTQMRKAALNVCDGLGAERIADCAESIRS